MATPENNRNNRRKVRMSLGSRVIGRSATKSRKLNRNTGRRNVPGFRARTKLAAKIRELDRKTA